MLIGEQLLRRRFAIFYTILPTVALLAAVAAVPGSVAIAADPPPTMSGTILSSTEAEKSNVECNPDGISSFDFSASGETSQKRWETEPAYIGTFTETGTATLGPALYDYGHAEVLTLDVSFTIQSGTTTIVGTKQLVQELPYSPSEGGRCIDLPSSIPGLGGATVIGGQHTSVTATLSYEVTISTESGEYTDSGSSRLGFSDDEVCVSWDCFFSSGLYEEFSSDYDNATPANVSVTPATAVNEVGDEHCVTATVTDTASNPTEDVTVFFAVSGTTTERDTSSGSAVTDSAGQAQFCYTAQFPGSDIITAVADADDNGAAELGEPTGTASKTYVLPTSTAACQVTISDGGWIIAANGDRASFGGSAKEKGGQLRGQQVYQDHGPAQTFTANATSVSAMTCSGTDATIYGTATINGDGSYFFRIEVSDVSKNGKSDRYGILLSNGYDSGKMLLRGGNIIIKR